MSYQYNEGKYPVAFILSAPGTKEKKEKKPVVGVTGSNLNRALEKLNSEKSRIFPSTDRYDYHIVNSFPRPLSKSLGNNRTEGNKGEILEPSNITLIQTEIKDCDIVRKKSSIVKERISQDRSYPN